jgi:hypothetical protein
LAEAEAAPATGAPLKPAWFKASLMASRMPPEDSEAPATTSTLALFAFMTRSESSLKAASPMPAVSPLCSSSILSTLAALTVTATLMSPPWPLPTPI